MKKMSLMAVATAILAVGLTGCSQQAREQYDKAGDSLAKGAQETGKAMSTDAKVAGETVKDAAQEGQQAVENSGMTGQVRVALSNAHDLEIHDLNVDTVEKTIILKGMVKSEDDKKQAETLAKATAGNDYKVENQLTVGNW